MENYISVSEYDGKEVVMFNIGEYAKDSFNIDCEEIPASCLIGRVPEFMSDTDIDVPATNPI